MTRMGTAAIILILGLVFAGTVIYPLTETFRQSLLINGSLSFENYRSLFSFANTTNWSAVRNSLWVSCLSVVFSGIVGTLLALVVTQNTFPLKRWVERFAILPIALPPLVGVIAFMFVFGESGIIPRLIRSALGADPASFGLDGIPAIVVVHTYSFNVYFFLFASNALRQLDGSLLEASASLGGSSLQTFIRIVLPSLRPALVGASLLTFMMSMASFSAPFLFGGDARFMTTQMYNEKLNAEVGRAAAQAVGLTLLSVLCFVALRISAKETVMRTKGTSGTRTLRIPQPFRALLVTICMAIIVLELLPILTILLISFAKEGSWTWQLLPQAYSLDSYIKLVLEPGVFLPIGNSLLMGFLTLGATLLVGPVTAHLLVKGKMRGRFLWDLIVSLPFALPGTVVALSLTLAFNTPTILTGYTVLVGTFWILPLAYVVRTYPLVVRSTSAALQQVDDSLAEAGKSLGAGPGRAFLRITLPLILPAIISGGLLTLIAALGEFVSSILLYTYSSRPVSVEILAQLRGYDFGGAAAYCVFLLVLIFLLTTISSRLTRRYSTSGQSTYF